MLDSYTRIEMQDVAVTLPPVWYSYQWAHDPIPGRWWAWDVTQAQRLVSALRRSDPELLDRAVTRYPISMFLEPLAGNHVNREYARTLSTERLAEPIFGVCLPLPITSGGERVGVMIDGNHRLWRRHDLGYDTIDVLHLPDEVEQAIRFTPDMVRAIVALGLV